jgi:hypothetical protein
LLQQVNVIGFDRISDRVILAHNSLSQKMGDGLVKVVNMHSITKHLARITGKM